MDDQITSIPIDEIVEPWILLRPVLTDSIEYLEMLESLRANGFLNSISVRSSKRKPGKYEVIDGMYRTTCARELRFETIPCIIKQNISDEDILALQIQAQAIRPETKPVEFARQLKRIQKARPGITLTQLASFVNKSPNWVGKQLQLLHLPPAIRKAVDRGEIPLQNAYMLARLPDKLRSKHIKQSKTMGTKEFIPLIAGVLKQYKEVVRQGKLDLFFTNDFQPQPHLRPLKEIRTEAESKTEAHLVLTSIRCKTAIEGWQAALNWVMHLDSRSVEEQKVAAQLRAKHRWSKTEEYD